MKYQIKRWWCVRVVDISFVVIPKWGHFQVNYTYFFFEFGFFSLLVNLSSILIRMCMLLFADFVIQNARSIHSFVEIFVEHQRKNSFVFYVTRVGLSDGNSRGFFLIWDSFRFFFLICFFCMRVCLCACVSVYTCHWLYIVLLADGSNKIEIKQIGKMTWNWSVAASVIKIWTLSML